jgi:DNA-binding XRE family transcriptional regulator
MRLSNSELIFVYRRRRGYTQAEAADKWLMGLPVADYRSLENGEEKPSRSLVRAMKAGGSLTENEIATIKRRREGMTQPELAEELGISVNWLCRMEKGSAPMNEDLREYWGLPA